jgi:predicted phage-related endonuclease
MINSNEFEKNALKEVMEVKRDRFRVNIRKKDVENKLKLRRNQLFSPPEK